MKNSILLLVLTFSLNSFSFALPDVYKEVNRKVFIDFKNVNLGDDHQEVVFVEFHIVDDKIVIDDILSENNLIEERLLQRLNHITIRSEYEENKLYRIKVCFVDENID